MYPISYEADAILDGQKSPDNVFPIPAHHPVAHSCCPLRLVAAFFAAVIAWFAIVFTGRYPRGPYDFNAGFLRMTTRVNGFYYLLNDEWPPFGGEEAPSYPVRVGVPEPLDTYSRLKTGFRFIVGIPVMILGWVWSLILAVVSFIAWFAILFTGKLPGTVRANAQCFRLPRRRRYFLLLTEDWPPFSYEEGGAAPAGQISSEAASRQE